MTVHGFKSQQQAKGLADLDLDKNPTPKPLGAVLTAWIVETPEGGIPAAVGDSPGYATCKCFWYSDDIDPDDVELEEMIDPDTGEQVEEVIFHQGPKAIGADQRLLCLSFFGRPLAIVNYCP